MYSVFVFQLSVLIYDLLVTEVWKQKVFPEILDADFEPKTTFPLYMTVSNLQKSFFKQSLKNRPKVAFQD